MLIKIFLLHCLIVNSIAWLAPERCEQNKKLETSATAGIKNVSLTASAEDLAKKQHEMLAQAYKDKQFLGVPMSAEVVNFDNSSILPPNIKIHTAYNCAFHTYNPRLIASVACQDIICKLSHTVATVDTYTASEGYNWGVKISSKFTLDKVFEIGGEVSVGGTYSCTYTKGRTTTDLVECSDSSGKNGTIQLYNVKSDMICDFGTITLEAENRMQNSTLMLPKVNDTVNYVNTSIVEGYNTRLGNFGAFVVLTEEETKDVFASFQVSVFEGQWVVIDTSKIATSVLQKIMNRIPLYNPYTDFLFKFTDTLLGVIFYKEILSEQQYRNIIPFTNEGGDAIYQYACVKTPF